jgi:hypothetical protein
MTKDEFERLIDGSPSELRAKGVLLFNGVSKCASEYHRQPSASNLKDWEAAEASLAKFVSALAAPAAAASRDSLATVAEVLNYLVAAGWKVTRASLYRHQQMGKIVPDETGAYRQKDVDKYARTFLKQIATGKRVSEKMDELQRKKIQLEIDNQEEDLKRKRWNREREEGKYIKRDEVELELAARAGILDVGLKHWIKAHAADLIRLAGGDMAKVGELISVMARQMDEYINAYAAPMEFTVTIDGSSEPEGQDGEPSGADRETNAASGEIEGPKE